MSFLIRAFLVIAVLSWMASQRQGEGVREAATIASPPLVDNLALTAAAIAAWDNLPDGMREATLRDGSSEIGRRIFGPATAAPSRDTLSESDRKFPWRGAQTHADPDRVSARGERPVR